MLPKKVHLVQSGRRTLSRPVIRFAAIQDPLHELRLHRACDVCGLTPSEDPTVTIVFCEHCNLGTYCSRDCALAGWPAHEADCAAECAEQEAEEAALEGAGGTDAGGSGAGPSTSEAVDDQDTEALEEALDRARLKRAQEMSERAIAGATKLCDDFNAMLGGDGGDDGGSGAGPSTSG